MSTYIALLKGVNVGGHNKIPMSKLRELLTKEGFQNVQTYIQSGNIIFQSSDKTDVIENNIQKAIHVHFGFDVAVIVKTYQELQDIFDACPFSAKKKGKELFYTAQQNS